jgi:hypothetical protein
MPDEGGNPRFEAIEGRLPNNHLEIEYWSTANISIKVDARESPLIARKLRFLRAVGGQRKSRPNRL